MKRFSFVLLLVFCAVSAHALDIGGYTIRQTNTVRNYTLPSTNLVPGGYIVIGRNATKSQFETNWGVTLATNVIYLNAANNFPRIDGQERFSLLNAGGTNIDGVTPASIDPVNRSVQRRSAVSNSTQTSSWYVVSSSAATPGTGGAGTNSGKLVINEYSDASSFSYEFVELFYDAAISNTPPVLFAIPDQIVTLSNSLQFSVSATPTDGDTVTLSVSNAPAGSTFSSTNENGTFIWTNAAPLGVYTTRVYAADHDGADWKAVKISVLDPPVARFALSEMITSEDIGTQAVQVVLSRSADATVQVSYAGTALYGVSNDYTLISTTVVFTDGGSTQASVNVAIRNDDATEGIETVILTLTNAAGATLGSPSQCTVSIRDNDAITIVTANLTSGSPTVYRDPGQRILRGLKPDICAIEEWNITNASDRTFIDQNFGTNYYYYKEPQATNFFPQPNGIVSRWPIKAAGEWSDAETVNRDFIWATIDIPGDRDLHVVVVHLYYSGGPDPREREARALTNYVAQAGFPANDYVVLCGDLNTVSDGEPCYQVLTNVFSDSHQPKDGRGNIYTSRNRDQRFDYILPKALLNSNHYTVTVSGSNFTDGLVFDTRLWTNGTPLPSPVLVNDSSATGGAHMAVMKAFSLGRTPPNLQAIGEQHVVEHYPLQLAVHATPTDGDVATLTASNLPGDATFSATNENGTLIWTNPAPAGIYTTMLYAADSDGVEQEAMTIHVLVDGQVWINEIHYDNASTDTNEGVEIAGTAGMDMSLYSLVAYKADGTLFSSNMLSGTIGDEGCGYGAFWQAIASLPNTTGGIALVQIGTNVVQFLSYEGPVVALEGPAIELTSEDIGVAEAGTETGKSLQLIGIGTNYAGFAWAGPTNGASPGFLNTRQTMYPCNGETNPPPALYTIGNRMVVHSNTLTISISAWDLNGNTVTLSVSNAPAGSAFYPTNENATFLWTNAAPTGTYSVAFYASSTNGADSETVLITVVSGTEPPAIAAIANKSVIQGHAISFDVVATDAENDPITLTVSNAPAGSTFGSTNGNGTFTWDNPTPIGVYTSRFYAVDKDGSTYTSVKIYVNGATNPPVFQPIGMRWTAASNTLSFGVAATDVDGDAITLSVSNAPAGSSFVDAGNGIGTFTWSNAAPVGIYTAMFYAVDNDGADIEPAVIKVVVNGSVWINELHYDNASTDTNEGVEVAGAAGADLSLYSIIAYKGNGSMDSSNSLSGYLPDEGCGYGAAWKAIAGILNSSGGVALVQSGTNLVQFISYGTTVTGTNGPAAGEVAERIPVTESASSPIGYSLQLTGVGTSYWQFAWGGATNLASRGTLNARQWIYPCGGTTNQPPFLYPIGNRPASQSNTLSFTVSATDVDNDPITLSVSNEPAGSTFTATNGLFTWTNAAPVGVYTSTFYAIDKDGSDSEIILITVNSNATNSPTIGAIGAKTVTVSNTLLFAVTATEPDGDPITLSVSNAPAGSEFSSTNGNGTFRWANTAPVGVYTSTFYAVDKDGFDSRSVSITVQAAQPPTTNALVLYDFEDGGGNFTNTADATHSNLTATTYTNDSGGGASYDRSPGKAINSSGWTGVTNHYFQFMFNVAQGYQVNATALNFDSSRSATGPTNWRVRCSSDGFATDLGAGAQTTNWITNTVSLSVSALTGTVAFRLYGEQASSSAGTWRHDNVKLLGTVEVAQNNDIDSDGLPNDWETLYFGDQTSGVPTADSDTDTMNNVSEFIAGTVPTNQLSIFEAEAFWTNSSGSVRFNSITNRVYGLYYKTNLFDASWLPWLTNIPGSNVTISIIVTNRPDLSYFKPGVHIP